MSDARCPTCTREMRIRTSRGIGNGERELRMECRHCGAKVVRVRKVTLHEQPKPK